MAKNKRAYVYIETNNPGENPEDIRGLFTVHYSGKPGNGSYRMQSWDEDFFIKHLRELRREQGITLVSKLPPKMPKEEGTLTRKPYIPNLK